jgi:hypothetical protein
VSRDFVSAAREAFRFLESQETFRVVQEDRTHVRYESAGIWLECWHDPRCEVDVSFGRLEKARLEKFSLWDVAEFKRARLRDPIYDSKSTSLESVLDELASFTREVCGPWLRGDSVSYVELQEFQAVASGLLTQASSRQARADSLWRPIKQAWQAGRFEEVARLVRALPQPMTESESRALEYVARTRATHGEQA